MAIVNGDVQLGRGLYNICADCILREGIKSNILNGEEREVGESRRTIDLHAGAGEIDVTDGNVDAGIESHADVVECS